jgi:hypothetical protein
MNSEILFELFVNSCYMYNVFDGQNINYQDYEISEDCKMKKINLSLWNIYIYINI